MPSHTDRLSVRLSVRPSVRLFVRLSVRLSIRRQMYFVYPSVCQKFRPSVRFSFLAFICHFIRPSVRPSVQRSICLSRQFFGQSILSWFFYPSVHPCVDPIMRLFHGTPMFQVSTNFHQPIRYSSVRQSDSVRRRSVRPFIRQSSSRPSVGPSVRPAVRPTHLPILIVLPRKNTSL